MPRTAAPSVLLAALLSGCTLLDPDTQVNIASDPPGARVVINRKDSGFVTPCHLDLETHETQRIDLEYPGYVTATRILQPDTSLYTNLWNEMYIRAEIWFFPLWLNTSDFFVPLHFERNFAPSHLYVRLDRSADS